MSQRTFAKNNRGIFHDHCHHHLRKEGFGQACHLAGGISAWSQAGNTVAR